MSQFFSVFLFSPFFWLVVLGMRSGEIGGGGATRAVKMTMMMFMMFFPNADAILKDTM